MFSADFNGGRRQAVVCRQRRESIHKPKVDDGRQSGASEHASRLHYHAGG